MNAVEGFPFVPLDAAQAIMQLAKDSPATHLVGLYHAATRTLVIANKGDGEEVQWQVSRPMERNFVRQIAAAAGYTDAEFQFIELGGVEFVPGDPGAAN